MENENRDQSVLAKNSDNGFWKMFSLLVSILFIGSLIYYVGFTNQTNSLQENKNVEANITEKTTLPNVILPIEWKDIGQKMVKLGVIDQPAFENIYARRGGLTGEEKSLLDNSPGKQVVINEQNAGYLLNLFWAFGLANKNPILEKGPMQNPEYGGAGRFASTGGWTLAKDNPMDHYSRHEMVKLTSDQQLLIEEVSQNIYRPCCGNSTYFPDCNHGMAMLGLLELMAANGVSEKEMYKVALQVNTFWFPDTYLTIDKYLKSKGLSLASADPKEILGEDYSSAYGYANILSQVQTPEQKSSGGGCGV
ncbi:MAG: hypothetical protein Q7R86_01065 [bacterium]|nr:hypothetical protein [bacterium]